MTTAPICAECMSVTDVYPVVVGERGEFGMIGYFCIDCGIEMDEQGRRIRKI